MKVVLDKITKKYDLDTLGVEDVDLVVDNCVCGIVGEAGSGKSTIAHIVCGIVDADGGTLTFDNKVMNRVPPKKRDAVLITDRSPLGGSVKRVLSYGLKLRRFPRAEIKRRVTAAAELFGFENRLDVNAGTLSAADAVRLGLARAAARKAAIVVIDEPYARVSGEERASLYADIKKLREYTGGAVFVFSSDGAGAEYTGDVISVLRNGRIVRTGSFAELTADPRTAYVARLIGEMPVNILVTAEGTFAVRADEARLTGGDFPVVGVGAFGSGSAVALLVRENEPPFVVCADETELKVGDRAGYEIVRKTKLTDEELPSD